MVYKDMHQRRHSNTAGVEHGGTPGVAPNPGKDATKDTNEEPQKGAPPKNGENNERSHAERKECEKPLN